jgi:hypothetical protein
MFARPNADHFQLAYVTNDIERAIRTFAGDYDFPGWDTLRPSYPDRRR